MIDLFWLSEAQVRRIEPFFPLSHGVPRVDDRRVISGIIFVIRNGLRWRDAPAAYGPSKTLYNRFVLEPTGCIRPHLYHARSPCWQTGLRDDR
jgi:transposase